MSEPENFLTRWSRRKRVADQPEPAADAMPHRDAPRSEPGGKPAAAPGAPAESAPAEPVFDPASLPSLDSIGAQTDISAFLKPGVPSELRHAALRRAWSMDPAIRDFKGLQENDWNFNDPNGIPGFGELDPSFDVKKMLADLFGETPRADANPTETPTQAEQLTPPSQQSSASIDRDARESSGESARDSAMDNSSRTATTESKDLVRREDNIATQKENANPDDAKIKRRRSRGSALPH